MDHQGMRKRLSRPVKELVATVSRCSGSLGISTGKAASEAETGNPVTGTPRRQQSMMGRMVRLGLGAVSALLLSQPVPALAQDVLYAVTYQPGAVEAFGIGPTGLPKSIGSLAVSGPDSIALYKNKFAYLVSTRQPAKLHMFSISANGMLVRGPTADLVLPSGSLAVDDGNGFVYTTHSEFAVEHPNLNYHRLTKWIINSNTGVVTPVVQVETPSWCGIDGVAVNRAGTVVYAACNQPTGYILVCPLDSNGIPRCKNYVRAGGNTNALKVSSAGYVYSVNPGTQTLSAFAPTTDGKNLRQLAELQNGVIPWDIAISRNGTFLYTANYLTKNLDKYVVSTFRIQTDGTPTLKGYSGGGLQSRSVALDPRDEHLYVASDPEDRIYVYDRDATTGGLTSRGFVRTAGHRPISIIATSITR